LSSTSVDSRVSADASSRQDAPPAHLLEWDSTFWGVTVGRVAGETLTVDGWAAVDAWARARNVDSLYFLASSDDPQTTRIAQDAGFLLVDVRVELTQPSRPVDVARRVRPFDPGDLPTLRSIARMSHENTRFYADPHFPRERCSDLYDTWIVRSCEGWADAVLVAEVEGRAAGYVTCHLDAASRRGSIGLIAAAAHVRSKGLGRELVIGALHWCRAQDMTEVSVVTQGSNVRAQRTFQACGFRTSATGLWFHRWYDR
jgi:dTDP-4-amino-4,6-dideoxy-D-galactose acyltransferase